jgi:hypothetical protein
MFYHPQVPVELPCAVLISQGSTASIGSARARLGLLLEWKKVADARGRWAWAGLVVFAYPPVGVGGSWELRLTWMDAAYLTPVAAGAAGTVRP